MTVTIELPPDIEAGLLAQAQAGAYARPAYELPPEEWIRRFDAWVASHAGNTVVLPDEAMEREAIYGDRGLEGGLRNDD